ncbi:NAD(P)H-hydrate epimerase, partial [Moraxella sp.]|uniref:NAD(P)H-hydrate epimerase n=1 Tax=Moraxella sp. TaxID=479 RepID=UPI00260CC96F
MSVSIYDKPRSYDVFTAENISMWERVWIQGMAGFGLMRQAGLMLSEAVLDIMYAKGLYQASILVCCGMGNNGGDGYLVADHLARQGYTVTVFAPDTPKTADSQAAKELS